MLLVSIYPFWEGNLNILRNTTQALFLVASALVIFGIALTVTTGWTERSPERDVESTSTTKFVTDADEV